MYVELNAHLYQDSTEIPAVGHNNNNCYNHTLKIIEFDIRGAVFFLYTQVLKNLTWQPHGESLTRLNTGKIKDPTLVFFFPLSQMGGSHDIGKKILIPHSQSGVRFQLNRRTAGERSRK